MPQISLGKAEKISLHTFKSNMLAQQILVLFVQVRILMELHNNCKLIVWLRTTKD